VQINRDRTAQGIGRFIESLIAVSGWPADRKIDFYIDGIFDADIGGLDSNDVLIAIPLMLVQKHRTFSNALIQEAYTLKVFRNQYSYDLDEGRLLFILAHEMAHKVLGHEKISDLSDPVQVAKSWAQEDAADDLAGIWMKKLGVIDVVAIVAPLMERLQAAFYTMPSSEGEGDAHRPPVERIERFKRLQQEKLQTIPPGDEWSLLKDIFTDDHFRLLAEADQLEMPDANLENLIQSIEIDFGNPRKDDRGRIYFESEASEFFMTNNEFIDYVARMMPNPVVGLDKYFHVIQRDNKGIVQFFPAGRNELRQAQHGIMSKIGAVFENGLWKPVNASENAKLITDAKELETMRAGGAMWQTLLAFVSSLVMRNLRKTESRIREQRENMIDEILKTMGIPEAQILPILNQFGAHPELVMPQAAIAELADKIRGFFAALGAADTKGESLEAAKKDVEAPETAAFDEKTEAVARQLYEVIKGIKKGTIVQVNIDDEITGADGFARAILNSISSLPELKVQIVVKNNRQKSNLDKFLDRAASAEIKKSRRSAQVAAAKDARILMDKAHVLGTGNAQKADSNTQTVETNRTEAGEMIEHSDERLTQIFVALLAAVALKNQASDHADLFRIDPATGVLHITNLKALSMLGLVIHMLAADAEAARSVRQAA
jgi:hypothetical protein